MKIKPNVRALAMRLRGNSDGAVEPIRVFKEEDCKHTDTVCDHCLPMWLSDYEVLDSEDTLDDI